MKIIKWIYNNILFIFTLFLLAFIPLYPKLPVVGVQHTWVYVRAEDFIVAVVFLLWLILMISKKITFKTPLTMPIIIFWIIGAISTLHGIMLVFPTLVAVFPNVAFLSYLRRIEYVSLFFIAYSSIKDKRAISYVIIVLTITLLLVSLYGIGQKYLGFPAYLTMNEEFAKGIPIKLSQLSRVSSTFGGHYDLAAYFVLMIPLLTSMIFGFKNWFVKFSLLIVVGLSFVVLFMTVMRSSFFVLLLSLILVLIFHKKKFAILAMIFFFSAALLFLSFSTSLLQRFGNTFKEIDVLVVAKTGEAVGQVKEVQSEYFKDKIIKIRSAQSKKDIDAAIGYRKYDVRLASDSAQIISYTLLPKNVSLFIEPNSPTGESLPQGTGYINLTLSPIIKKVDQFFYQRYNNKEADKQDEIIAIDGDFLIKRVVAYDLSFTTRFQGEWPKTIGIFKKDIFFGGGYSSTGLAVDNNYLRILGEIGLLGFCSYFAILLFAGIYIKKILPEVDSPVIKSFVFGFIAGSFGLALNATLIDVFEASKIAFTFWLLIGVTLGILHLYQKKEINLYGEAKRIVTSTYAIIVYLFIATFVLFSSVSSNYFVGDDFTWLRWAADCNTGINKLDQCQSIISTLLSYFTEANGFFFRPGTKIYFFTMYSGFWLNQTVYHVVSILLHFIVTALLFLLAKKILKNFLLSALAAFLFIILSGYSEVVFWISSTGFLFNAIFILLSLYLFILWREKKKNIYLLLSFLSIILSLLFHELGVIAPLLIVLYGFVFEEKLNFKRLFQKIHYSIFFLPILPYLILRYFAQSHWFNGDYSYNLFKLPFNIVGNTIGYLMLALLGPQSLPIYQKFREFSKEHVILVLALSLIIIFLMIFIYRIFIKKMIEEEKRIVVFGSLFFIIALLPFLGLGNITSRYSYLSSVGFIILFAFFLKKIYSNLSFNGRDISIASILVIIGIFSLIHVIQLQKIQTNWNEAGEETKRFLTSLDQVYTNYWTKEPMNFYFVNVPIRVGDAWVFPVGLKDAVWFVFRNDQINVTQSSSLEDALDTVRNIRSDKVFEFDKSGSVVERKKEKNINVIPIKK